MKNNQKVLVYPCGSEIGLEIYKAVAFSTYFDLWGGSSNYDHGQYVYKRYIDNLPYISDTSNEHDVLEFQEKIKEYNIDYIYPAVDSIVFKLSQYASLFTSNIIAPDFNTAHVTRSKKLTYELFGAYIATPKIYNKIDEIATYPVFIKPDIGQGSNGAQRIGNKNILYNINLEGMLIMEYLPGDEYTIDCFTNNTGKLIYISPRYRNRIANGTSMSSSAAAGINFIKIAAIINEKLNQRGGWFFQVKENDKGEPVLLEIASRIAGTSAYTRSKGVNLPLLTLYLYSGNEIEQVYENKYDIIIDRALSNSYATNLHYNKVYVDYDDTVVFNEKINIQLIAFLYQCINNEIPIVLLTKHIGDLTRELKRRRLYHIFNKIIHIRPDEQKYTYIDDERAILIDDSFGERNTVYKNLGINVFDTHMIECLIDPLKIQ
jgi:hypothetical protein